MNLTKSFRFELDGVQFAVNAGALVRIDPFDTEPVLLTNPVTINNGASTAIFTPSLTADYYVLFVNESIAGQQIGIGHTNLVTMANCDVLLNPGDSWEMYFAQLSFFAIASAAGALLRHSIKGTS